MTIYRNLPCTLPCNFCTWRLLNIKSRDFWASIGTIVMREESNLGLWRNLRARIIPPFLGFLRNMLEISVPSQNKSSVRLKTSNLYIPKRKSYLYHVFFSTNEYEIWFLKPIKSITIGLFTFSCNLRYTAFFTAQIYRFLAVDIP